MAERERDPAKTRRLVLDAASRMVVAKGAGASIDTIAKAAGVSKGGLLHHFRSRDELLLALAADLLQRFRDAVQAAADPADRAEGRLMRGYIRASFDTLRDESSPVEHLALITGLASVPGVDELMRRDSEAWDEYFASDGLSPDRQLIIFRATDGAGIAGIYEGGHSHEQLEQTRELLIALTRQSGPLLRPA